MKEERISKNCLAKSVPLRPSTRNISASNSTAFTSTLSRSSGRKTKARANLAFLPGLVNAYTQVRALAAKGNLPVNADIQTKLLKGDSDQRKMLLTALPQFTLMLYELSSPTDGESAAAKTAKVQSESQNYLQMAADGLDASALGRIGIGLRTPDYGDLLPQMLSALDAANGTNTLYGGWARHSYNDVLGQ